jgi:tetratricopeptide (TPR) repeat protein
MSHTFSKSDLEYLKRYGGQKSPEDLAQRFDTDAATVLAKLRELGLAPRETASQRHRDPALGTFEDAMKALYERRFDQAAELFEKVVAETDQMDLAARARQHLAACRSRLVQGDGATDGDPFLRAVLLKNHGRLKEALEIAETHAHRDQQDDRYIYLAASVHALAARPQEAREALARAIQLNPKNRVYAFHDPDFAAVREDEAFSQIFETP